MPSLVFIRHGKSYKNVQDRHGGPGSSLVVEGKLEITKSATRLKEKGIHPLSIFSSPVPQAIESANILGLSFGVDVVIESLLKPLNLGVLGGLSHQEAILQYPDSAALIEKWRRGEIEIHQLLLPESEDYREFYDRGRRFLQKCSDIDKDLLVVGTRSILICLISILIGRSIEPNGGYREIPISCSDFFWFRKINRCYELDAERSECIFIKE